MELGLAGKTVLVTGGSKGIGLAVARAFIREGARVGIVSRDGGNLEQARKVLEEEEGAVIAVARADLSQSEQADAAVAAITQRLGSIDILVNSAGAARRNPPESLDSAAWHAALDAKYFTYIHTQDAVLKRWVDKARSAGTDQAGGAPSRQLGAIVNIVGTGGRVPHPSHVAGGAANAALLLSTLGLASHYARYGIRLNVVNPGYTLTERMDQTVAQEALRLGGSREKALERLSAELPLRRFGEPDEIANVVLFLASERASYVVGALISVDGGQHPII